MSHPVKCLPIRMSLGAILLLLALGCGTTRDPGEPETTGTLVGNPVAPESRDGRDASLLLERGISLSCELRELPRAVDALLNSRSYQVLSHALDSHGDTLISNGKLPLALLLRRGPARASLWTGGGRTTMVGETLFVSSREVVKLHAGYESGPLALAAWIRSSPGSTMQATLLELEIAPTPIEGHITLTVDCFQPGASLWCQSLEAVFMDFNSVPILPGANVSWRCEPGNIASVAEDSAIELDGVARNRVCYHHLSMGDTLRGIYAATLGLVQDASAPHGWRLGQVTASLEVDGELLPMLRLPFCAGTGMDNLHLVLQTEEIVFEPACGGDPQLIRIPARVSLVDGYGAAAAGYDVELLSSVGGVFVPPFGRTDANGVIDTFLEVWSSALTPMGQSCPSPHTDCLQMEALELSVSARLLEDPTIQTRPVPVVLTQPCPEE